ncbi:MAG: hypothetical protein CL916_12950 [Deltaproteobacteria bacterium]|nr:hypothetical protein [Deltaproteobacteria bacterium]
MEFLDDFDERLAKEGPPSVFTLNYEGCLQFDLLRSRDIARQNPNAKRHEWCHCVYVDHETLWPQYVLCTSPELCQRHERASIFRFESYAEAILYMEEKKQVVYEKNRLC